MRLEDVIRELEARGGGDAKCTDSNEALCVFGDGFICFGKWSEKDGIEFSCYDEDGWLHAVYFDKDWEVIE